MELSIWSPKITHQLQGNLLMDQTSYYSQNFKDWDKKNKEKKKKKKFSGIHRCPCRSSPAWVIQSHHKLLLAFFLDSNKLSTLGKNLRQLFLPTNPRRRSFTLPSCLNTRGSTSWSWSKVTDEKEILSYPLAAAAAAATVSSWIHRYHIIARETTREPELNLEEFTAI